jgi:hypothetical protein
MRLFSRIREWMILLFLCSGCGVDGTDPFALFDTWHHPDNLFSFAYLSPPWMHHGDSTDTHPVMVVQVYDELTEGNMGSRMRLEAWSQPDMAIRELSAERYRFWKRAGYQVSPVVSYLHFDGMEGLEVVARFSAHHVHEVFFRCHAGTVAFSMWVHGDDRNGDAALLLSSFRPGRCGGADDL